MDLFLSPPGTFSRPEPKAVAPGLSSLSTWGKQSASSALGSCRPVLELLRWWFFRSEQNSESSSVILRSRAPQALEIPDIQVRAELRLDKIKLKSYNYSIIPTWSNWWEVCWCKGCWYQNPSETMLVAPRTVKFLCRPLVWQHWLSHTSEPGFSCPLLQEGSNCRPCRHFRPRAH